MNKAKEWILRAAKDPFDTALSVAVWIAWAAFGIFILKLVSIWALSLIGVF